MDAVCLGAGGRAWGISGLQSDAAVRGNPRRWWLNEPLRWAVVGPALWWAAVGPVLPGGLGPGWGLDTSFSFPCFQKVEQVAAARIKLILRDASGL